MEGAQCDILTPTVSRTRTPGLLLRELGQSAGRSSPAGLFAFLGGSATHLVRRRRANPGYRVDAGLVGSRRAATAPDIIVTSGDAIYDISEARRPFQRGDLTGETPVSNRPIEAAQNRSVFNRPSTTSTKRAKVSIAASGLLDRARIVAPPGFNRWLAPPPALGLHRDTDRDVVRLDRSQPGRRL